MANIKISELNSLSKKAYNDIVPIVDVSANETKKVSIEELVDNNVSLIAVTDTAPSECEEGDMYYNTTTNLIYTATDDNTWGETGETPKNGIMYIVYSKKSTYAYDGETLISVGGGSGAYIGTTEPPQDDNSNVWINPNESVNVYGSYISNSYGTSQEIGYSQEYVNGIAGKVLFESASGTTGSIPLSNNISNDFDWSKYKMIELVAVNNDDTTETFDTYRFDTSLSKFRLMGESVGATSFNIFEKTYTKGTNSLATTTGKLYSGSNGSVTNYDVFKIIKVIGYE